jgi:hypothetical protein
MTLGSFHEWVSRSDELRKIHADGSLLMESETRSLQLKARK